MNVIFDEADVPERRLTGRDRGSLAVATGGPPKASWLPNPHLDHRLPIWAYLELVGCVRESL